MTSDLDPSSVGLSIVLPAYDEAQNILAAVRSVSDVARCLVSRYEIIVVDDGSTDATAALVTDLARTDPHIRLISHGRNRGYGEALRTGFTAATMPLVFFTDADNQFDPAELRRFLPHSRYADVVAGYRLNRQDTLVRRVNAMGWNFLVRVLFHVPVRDIDCAFKVFRREVFDDVDLQSVGAMVNTELMVKIGRAGASVVEIGVTHYPRTAGRARGANPRVIATALWELVKMFNTLRPLAAKELPAHLDWAPTQVQGPAEGADPGPDSGAAPETAA